MKCWWDYLWVKWRTLWYILISCNSKSQFKTLKCIPSIYTPAVCLSPWVPCVWCVWRGSSVLVLSIGDRVWVQAAVDLLGAESQLKIRLWCVLRCLSGHCSVQTPFRDCHPCSCRGKNTTPSSFSSIKISTGCAEKARCRGSNWFIVSLKWMNNGQFVNKASSGRQGAGRKPHI